MWKVLAAKGWMELGKKGRARGCLEEAAPVYDGVRWRGIGEMLAWLKEQSGFMERGGRGGVGEFVDGDEGVLVGPEEENLSLSTRGLGMGAIEGERLELGGHVRSQSGHHKRMKSVDGGALALGGLTDDERVNDDDEFEDS